MTGLFKHLLPLLLPGLGYRLKLVWRVLRGDWMFLPGDGSFHHASAAELADVSDEEIQSRMPTLDSVSREDISRYLRVCRLLAIPMKHPELFGNAIIRGSCFSLPGNGNGPFGICTDCDWPRSEAEIMRVLKCSLNTTA